MLCQVQDMYARLEARATSPHMHGAETVVLQSCRLVNADAQLRFEVSLTSLQDSSSDTTPLMFTPATRFSKLAAAILTKP